MNAEATDELVSIVIPVYNGTDYLAFAIDSALRQSWSNTEVIVVDDGSTDNGATETVCRRYGDAIRYIRKDNGGVATALNAGIEAMRGGYFSWLSHDDIYTPERIEIMIDAARAVGEPAIGCTDYQVMDEYGVPGKGVRRKATFSSRDWHLALTHQNINGCTAFVPRVCFEECGMFHPGLATTQDFDMWLRLSIRYPFYFVPKITVQSRRHARQGSRTPYHASEAMVVRTHWADAMSTDPAIRVEHGELDTLREHAAASENRQFTALVLYMSGRMKSVVENLPVTVILGGSWSTRAAARFRRAARNGEATICEVVTLPRCHDPGGAPPSDADRARADSVFEDLLQACRLAAGDAVWYVPAPVAAPWILFEKLRLAMTRDLSRPRLCLAEVAGRRRATSQLPLPLDYAFFEKRYLENSLGCAGEPSPERLAHDWMRDDATTLVHHRPRGFVARLWTQWRVSPAPASVFVRENETVRQLATLLADKRQEPPHVDPEEPVLDDGERIVVLLAPRESRFGTRLADDLGEQLADFLHVMQLVPGPGARVQSVVRVRGENTARTVRQEFLARRLEWLASRRVSLVLAVDPHLVGQTAREVAGRLAVPVDAVHRALPDGGDSPGASPTTHHANPAHASAAIGGWARTQYFIGFSKADSAVIPAFGAPIRVVAPPNPGRQSGFRPWLRRTCGDEPLRVVFIGELTRAAGLDDILSVTEESRRGRRRLYLLVCSRRPDAKLLRGPENVGILAVSDYAQLTEAVCAFNPNLAWFPFLECDGFNYDLRDAEDRGLPIVARDVGNARNQLGDRRLTWLAPAGTRRGQWFDYFDKVANCRQPPPLHPTDPLRPLDPRHDELCRAVLGSL